MLLVLCRPITIPSRQLQSDSNSASPLESPTDHSPIVDKCYYIQSDVPLSSVKLDQVEQKITDIDTDIPISQVVADKYVPFNQLISNSTCDPAVLDWDYADLCRSYGVRGFSRELILRIYSQNMVRLLRSMVDPYHTFPSLFHFATLPAPPSSDQSRLDPYVELVHQLKEMLDTAVDLLYLGSGTASEALTFTHAVCSALACAQYQQRGVKVPGRGYCALQSLGDPGFDSLNEVAKLLDRGEAPPGWTSAARPFMYEPSTFADQLKFGTFIGSNGGPVGPMACAGMRATLRCSSFGNHLWTWITPPLTSGENLDEADVLILEQRENEAIMQIKGADIHCFLLEPILGPTGVWKFRRTFIQELFRVLREKKVWIILDEVMTGFRTGQPLAIMHVSDSSSESGDFVVDI